jgi:hypothetical protein
MDKALYCRAVEVQGLEQVGAGIRIGDDMGITDHYGLHARVKLIGGCGVVVWIRGGGLVM